MKRDSNCDTVKWLFRASCHVEKIPFPPFRNLRKQISICLFDKMLAQVKSNESFFPIGHLKSWQVLIGVLAMQLEMSSNPLAQKLSSFPLLTKEVFFFTFHSFLEYFRITFKFISVAIVNLYYSSKAVMCYISLHHFIGFGCPCFFL